MKGFFAEGKTRQLKSWLSLRAPPLAPMSSHFVTDSEDLWERWSQPLWLQPFFFGRWYEMSLKFLRVDILPENWWLEDDFVLFGFRPILQGEMLVVLGRYHLSSRRFRVYLQKNTAGVSCTSGCNGWDVWISGLTLGKSLLFPLVFSTGTFEASILRRIRQPDWEPGSSFSVPTLEKFQGSNGRETFPSCN